MSDLNVNSQSAAHDGDDTEALVSEIFDAAFLAMQKRGMTIDNADRLKVSISTKRRAERKHDHTAYLGVVALIIQDRDILKDASKHYSDHVLNNFFGGKEHFEYLIEKTLNNISAQTLNAPTAQIYPNAYETTLQELRIKKGLTIEAASSTFNFSAARPEAAQRREAFAVKKTSPGNSKPLHQNIITVSPPAKKVLELPFIPLDNIEPDELKRFETITGAVIESIEEAYTQAVRPSEDNAESYDGRLLSPNSLAALIKGKPYMTTVFIDAMETLGVSKRDALSFIPKPQNNILEANQSPGL